MFNKIVSKTILPVIGVMGFFIAIGDLVTTKNRVMFGLSQNPILKYLFWAIILTIIVLVVWYIIIKHLKKEASLNQLKDVELGLKTAVNLALTLLGVIIVVLLISGNEANRCPVTNPNDSTVLHNVYDTIKIKIPEYEKTKANPSSPSQKNDSGGSGILNNNTTVNAPQAGRDLNLYAPVSRIITEKDLFDLFLNVPDKNTRIGFMFLGQPTEEMDSVEYQAIKILREHGYKNIEENGTIGTITLPTSKKISFNVLSGVVYVTIPQNQ